MSEPVTHYDQNDPHTYKMTNTLEPGDTAPDGSTYSEVDAFNDATELGIEICTNKMSYCCTALVTETGFCTFCWEKA